MNGELDLAARLEREEQIFHLRNAGWTTREIARDQGLSQPRIVQILNRAVEKTRYPYVQKLREQQGQEIRELLDVYLPEAKQGHHAAAHVCLKLWERHAKLFGLDAPQRHEIDSDSPKPWDAVFDAVLVDDVSAEIEGTADEQES